MCFDSASPALYRYGGALLVARALARRLEHAPEKYLQFFMLGSFFLSVRVVSLWRFVKGGRGEDWACHVSIGGTHAGVNTGIGTPGVVS